MRLMLLRHAKSEKAEPGMSDHPRRLNARGKNDASVIGGYMARHALAADLVLVSTAERTRQTWERVAAALSKPPRVVYEERLYNAGAEAIIALVKKTAPAVRALLVIGHNPGLHDAARRLIASGDVEARADHADFDVEIEGERPARGRRHHGRRVPGRHVGRSLGRVHVFSPGGQVIARHASVPAAKFANPCGTPGFGFEVAMRAC